jgi:hypothetical protein
VEQATASDIEEVGAPSTSSNKWSRISSFHWKTTMKSMAMSMLHYQAGGHFAVLVGSEETTLTNPQLIFL